MAEFVFGTIVGANVALILLYIAFWFVSRKERSGMSLKAREELAFDALRKISRVPKVEHAHKIAARTLSAVD